MGLGLALVMSSFSQTQTFLVAPHSQVSWLDLVLEFFNILSFLTLETMSGQCQKFNSTEISVNPLFLVNLSSNFNSFFNKLFLVLLFSGIANKFKMFQINHMKPLKLLSCFAFAH